jgi:hypothetical protein
MLASPILSTDKTAIARRFITIILGLTAIGLGIYYGIPSLRGNSVTAPATAKPSTTTTSASDQQDVSDTKTSICTTGQLDTISSVQKYAAWETPIKSYLDLKRANTNPLQTDLDTVNSKHTEIKSLYDCLHKNKMDVENIATNVDTSNTENTNLVDTIKRRKIDIQVATDRAALAINPDLNRSYYSGWFPMDRPMKGSTVPILIGVSLFFISMTFFIMLATFGMDVRILVPNVVVNPIASSSPERMGTIIKVLGGIVVIMTGVVIYAFVSKK